MDSMELKKLQVEIKKYTGGKYSNQVKTVATEAANIQITNKFQFPISTEQSPFSRAYVAIVSDKTISKQNLALNERIIDAIRQNVFSSQALSQILLAMQAFSRHLEETTALKLLQANSTIILNNINYLSAISAIFSISISLIQHHKQSVSTAAFASTQQMITTLFQKLSTDTPMQIQIGDKTFGNHIIGIICTLFNDIVLIMHKQKATYIIVNRISSTSLFNLWNIVIQSNYEAIIQHKELLKPIEASLDLPLNEESIQFYLSFMSHYYGQIAGAEERIVTMALNTQPAHVAMVFFRNLFYSFFKKKNLSVLFSAEIYYEIFSYMDENCNAETQQPLIDLTTPLIPISESLVYKDKEYYSKKSAIEIAIIYVNSCQSVTKSRKEGDEISPLYKELAPILSKIWQLLLNLILKGFRIVDPNSCEMILKAYSLLLLAVSKCCLTEASSIMLRILCSIVAKQKLIRSNLHQQEIISNTLLHTNTKGFEFKNKRSLTYQMLIIFLTAHPMFFSKFYQRLFVSIGMYPKAKIDPAFTLKMETRELNHMIEQLTRGTSFCINFISDVLTTNQDRFPDLWAQLSEKMADVIMNSELQEAGIELFIQVSSKNFEEEMISIILKTIDHLKINKKLVMLNQIRFFLHQHSNSIKTKWGDILSCISCTHCDGNDDLVSCAYASLSNVCNDHFRKLNQDEMQQCIGVVFEFALQSVNINTSLSSLCLLWVVAPFINKLSHFWKRILRETLVFFTDSRNDVATCAVKTFFLLLSSNKDQMPADIYDHLIVNCFIPLLMTFVEFPPESWTVQQQSLLEICHCACSFWDQFEPTPQFTSNFWCLLIDKQQKFMINCKNQEINVNALQFYEEAIQCTKLDILLRENLVSSYAQVVEYMLQNEPASSLVISGLGRSFIKILPSQKPFLNEKQLKFWLKSIEAVSLTLKSEDFVNITSQKMLESAAVLFPTSNEFGSLILQAYVKICMSTPSKFLRIALFDILCKLFETRIDKSFATQFVCECKPLFKYEEANKFLETIIKNNYSTGSEYSSEPLFEALESIPIKNVSMSEIISSKMINLFPSVSHSTRVRFFEEIKDKHYLLIYLWETFCSASSSMFNQEISDQFSSTILTYLYGLLNTGDNEAITMILSFMKKSEIQPKTIDNKKCSRVHLYPALSHILQLLENGQNEIIRQSAKEILKLIHQDIGILCC